MKPQCVRANCPNRKPMPGVHPTRRTAQLITSHPAMHAQENRYNLKRCKTVCDFRSNSTLPVPTLSNFSFIMTRLAGQQFNCMSKDRFDDSKTFADGFW